MGVIVDTVHGNDLAKLKKYRMNENEHFGSLAGESVFILRQVLNHLILKEYLYLTNEEYSLLKLTEKALDIMEGDQTVMMKLAKKQELVKKEKKVKKSAKGRKGKSYTEIDQDLFELLRNLRTEIAKEEKVPPYIVFSDKTLAELCYAKPETEETMLAVSGVGLWSFFCDCVDRPGDCRSGTKPENLGFGFRRVFWKGGLGLFVRLWGGGFGGSEEGEAHFV